MTPVLPAAALFFMPNWELGSCFTDVFEGGFSRVRGHFCWPLDLPLIQTSHWAAQRSKARGGYEGGSNLYEYGRPAFRWAGDIEDRIAAAMHRLVQQVWN